MKDICALIDQTEPLDISAKFCTQLRQIYGPALTSKNKKTLERTIRSFREKSGSQVFNAVFIYALLPLIMLWSLRAKEAFFAMQMSGRVQHSVFRSSPLL